MGHFKQINFIQGNELRRLPVEKRPRESASTLFTDQNALHLTDTEHGRLQISRYHVGTMTIAEVASTGHDVTVSEVAGATLLVPVRGRILSETRRNAMEAASGEIMFFSPNSRRTRVERFGDDDFLAIPLIIPVVELRKAAERNGFGRTFLRQLGDFSVRLRACDHPEVAELIGLTRILYDEVKRGSPRLARLEAHVSWVDLITDKAVEVLAVAQTAKSPSGGAADQTARRARDFMFEHYAEIETLADVAQHCGVSLRTLQQRFRSDMGLSPHKALTDIRLDASRRYLLSGDPRVNVTEAAMGSGFSHLGRFAAAYAKKYGELPSATLYR